MESGRVLLLVVLGASLLVVACRAQLSTEMRDTRASSWDIASVKDSSSLHEKELLEALQEVLEKLQSKRIPTWEKKFGQVALCGAGDQCAVRKGARIGKLCDCPRSYACNSFLLRCL
ncbi:cocaine- and amphetamine-regulated transcript protein [Lethenteron reissneri]|uniref:cocaine- and amphetamine-regulated transcript protein n=1 Tax=Lethenteron reissneri TaxID=7753 RepID=UPI002AB6431A|nr:cocaine- and amphetamine-regulated transcript protein [Lethenteron reissneri]